MSEVDAYDQLENNRIQRECPACSMREREGHSSKLEQATDLGIHIVKAKRQVINDQQLKLAIDG